MRFSYEVTVPPPDRGADRISVWIPLPTADPYQEVADIEVSATLAHRILADPEYGNRFLYLAGRPREGETIQISLSFTATRRAYRVGAGAERPAEAPEPALERFLRPDRLVPTDGVIEREARWVTRRARTPLEKARRLYDHIVESVDYNKDGQGWGRGDALYACDVRRGNCTDFHSLFIGEARALGIPARFVMGIPLPEGATEGPIAGYHCWAEFWTDDLGWVPVDASEARKHPEQREALFSGLDENRIRFTIGRDIPLPLAAAEPLNYAIYPHVEVDGAPFLGAAHRFTFREEEAL